MKPADITQEEIDKLRQEAGEIVNAASAGAPELGPHLAVGDDGRHVLVKFSRPAKGLSLNPSEALSLADLLRRHANRIKAADFKRRSEEKRKSKKH